MITRLLNLAGAVLPADLVGATKDNVHGHWEPAFLNGRNERFLNELGHTWSDWGRLDPASRPPEAVRAYVSDVRGFLARELADAPLVLIKEPRSCRILPSLAAALVEEGFSPRCVVPFRHPLEVAGSLHARDALPMRDGLLLWLRYVLDVERDSRGMPRSFLSYEALMQDWRGALDRLARDLGIAWPADLDDVAHEMDGFIDPASRHNRRTAQDLEDIVYARGLAREVFDALGALAADPLDPSALTVMDQARSRLDEIEDLTLAPRLAIAAEAADLRSRLASSETENRVLTDRVADLGHNLQGIWKLHDAVSEMNRRNEDFIADLRMRLAQAQTVHEAETQRLQAAEAERARLQAAVEAERVRFQAAEAERARLHDLLSQRQGEAEHLGRTLKAVHASASWRLTAPIRLAGRAARWVKPGLSRTAERLWRRLPVSPGRKQALKTAILGSSVGGMVLGRTAAYHRWEEGRNGRFGSVRQNGELVLQDKAGMISVDPGHHFRPKRTLAPLADPKARLIAFYLPQFHPIPENDEWWGAGFTEWTNVRPARPMFPGHYQPHEPLDLGYYDLRDTDVQRRQIDLARLYGVGGFCFYWYWFGGKRLLERPVEQWLADPTLDFPFCICWANENWTRRWDGADSKILIGQDHSPEDDLAFIAELAPYLRDPRYIRIDGKPLVLVYRPRLLPDPVATAARWRAWCRDNGIGDIHLAYTQSFETENPAVYGFDSAIEFPPNNASPPILTDRIEGKAPGFNGIVYDWNFYVDRSRRYSDPGYPLFRSVCPGWDNTARRKAGGAIFLGNTPQEYGVWLANAVTRAVADAATPDQRIVFCNAWNEWAEGAHLEPDTRFGHAFLEQTRDALDPAARPRHVTLVGHDAHPHGAQLLLLNLARTYRQAGLSVTILLLGGGPLLERYREVAETLSLPDPGSHPDDALALLRGLRHEDREVAILNTSVTGHVAPLLRAAGYRVVSLVHEMASVHEQMDLAPRMRALAEAAHAAVFPAPIVRQQFETTVGTPVTQAVLRPQGLYLRLTEAAPDARQAIRADLGYADGTRVLMGAGYIDHRKGVDLFVRTLADLRATGADVRGVWIGHHDQDFIGTVRSLAADLGVADALQLPGRVEDPARHFQAADVFLLTSREDPYPSVVLEAMAARCPVVMFRDATGCEVLADRGAAVAVPHSDSAAMAAAVAALMQDDARRLAMVDHAAGIVATETDFTAYAFDLLDIAGRPVPRISVIIPNYNYAHYIADRIRSVASQDMPVLEIIVLDDCSTDNSAAVIAELAATSPAPIRFVPNDRNSGSVFRQWRKGLDLARGDFVWIAEADDLAEPDFLSTVMRGFDVDGVVLSYSESAQIDREGRQTSPDYRYYTDPVDPQKWHQSHVARGPDEIATALFLKNTIPNVSATVLRRDAALRVFADHGPEIEALSFAGDWAFYLRMMEQGDIAFFATSLNYHRRHDAGVTISNFGQRQLDEIASVQSAVIARHGLRPDHSARAADYCLQLARQFGLSGPITSPEREKTDAET